MISVGEKRRPETRRIIKDAFLEMLKTQPFHKIRITRLCENADIARATFYANYIDVYDLLDETIDDALQLVHWKSAEEYTRELRDLWDMVDKDDMEAFKAYDRKKLPPPNRIVELKKYAPLFKDENIFFTIVKRIFEWEKRPFAAAAEKDYGLEQKEAENLLFFLVSGTMATNYFMKSGKSEEWYRLQLSLLKFIKNGFRGMRDEG